MAAAQNTRVVRARAVRGSADAPRSLSFVERTTLFIVALKRQHAPALLDGFATAQRHTAQVLAKQLTGLDSPTRQARVTLEFGARDDAADRLKVLLEQAPPRLKACLSQQLPPALRHLAPPQAAEALPPSPAMKALAARMIREASR